MRKIVKKTTRPKKMDKGEPVAPFKLYSVAEIMQMPIEPDEPVTAPEPSHTVNVIGLAINPKYVYASLNGDRISVRCNPNRAKSLVGKKIQVTKQQGSEHYEILNENN